MCTVTSHLSRGSSGSNVVITFQRADAARDERKAVRGQKRKSQSKRENPKKSNRFLRKKSGCDDCCTMQPWMRKEVLNKFGRTVKNRWEQKSSVVNPFSDPLRADIDPLPIEKRIRYWKLARGDRVCTAQIDC